MLVDFEDLKWAPVEIDLILYATSPNWGAFWKEYSKICPKFQINPDLMQFYMIRRNLDDISSDITRMLLDNPSEVEIAEITRISIKSIHEVQKQLSNK